MSYDYTHLHFEPVPDGWSGTRLEAVVTSGMVTLRRDGGNVYASMRPAVWAALLAYCEGEGIYTLDVRDCTDLPARRQFVAEVIYTLGEDLDFGEVLADAEA